MLSDSDTEPTVGLMPCCVKAPGTDVYSHVRRYRL